MAEIDYKKEKCWGIKEVHPIQVGVKRNRYNDWDLIIPPMSMTYDTFMLINTSMMIEEAYRISYDYVDGIATLSLTDKGFERLQNEFSHLITIKPDV